MWIVEEIITEENTMIPPDQPCRGLGRRQSTIIVIVAFSTIFPAVISIGFALE